jgi:hypothetical protein
MLCALQWQSRFGPQSDATPMQSAGYGAAQGFTLNFGDEIGGIIGALVDKFNGAENFVESYKKHSGNIRAMLDEAESANPGSYLAGEFAGGIAPSLIPGGQVVRGANMAQKIGRGIAGGAAYGTAAGAGAGVGASDTINKAAEGAIMGAGVGAAAPVVGNLAGRVAGKAVNAIANRAPGNAMQKAGVKSRKAYNRVAKSLQDDMAGGGQAINRMSQDDMLLNMGGNLRGQAEAIAKTPGPGGARLAKAAEQQLQSEGGRVEGAIDRIIGRDRGRVSNRKIVDAEKKAAGRLYNVAKASNVSHDMTPIRQSLEAIDRRGIVPSSVMERLFNSPAMKDAGPVSSAKLHDFRQLIDDVMGSKFGDTSLQGNAKGLISGLRKKADGALKVVPGWPKADKDFQIAATRKTAFEEGQKALSSAIAPDEVAEKLAEFNRISPKVGDMYRQGVRNSVSRIMGTAGNDAGAAIREIELKGWNSQKMANLIGSKQANELSGFLRAAKNRQDTARTLEGGARTAQLQKSMAQISNPVDRSGRVEAAAQRGIQGNIIKPIASVADKLVGGAIERRANAVNDDMARLLSSRGAGAQEVARGMIGQQVSNQARKRALEQAAIAGQLSGNNAYQSRQPVTIDVARPTNIDMLARILAGR